MHPSRRALLGGLAALPSVPGRARAAGGMLRYGLSAYPPNLQPWISTGASAGTVKMMLFGRLLSYDDRGALVGDLAQSWSLDPDGAWVFRLRPGVVFHNGEPFTAEDVRWTIEQIAGSRSAAYMRAQFAEVKAIEVPDPLTLRLVTTTPQATLPSWFANYNMGIVSRSSAGGEPVGAGPFVLAGQERGTSVTLAANPRYFRPGLPKLRGIRFVAYPDENLRAAALRSGDVDLIEYVPWQAMNAVEADPRLRLDVVDGAAFMDVLFNGTRPPFNDPRVRLAVALAIRREEIVKAVFFDRGKVLEGVPIVEGTPYFDAALSRGWAYDPRRAKALLAEAGLGGGFSTTLLATAQFGMHKDTAEIVQQHLAAIGIGCELKLPDWSSRVSLGTRGQYDMAIHGVAADNNDPDGLSVVLDTSLSPSHGRSFGVQAPRTVAALARGRAEFDDGRRVRIYREMQAAALEEVPLVGLAWRSQGFGMDRGVAGFTNLPGALSTSSGLTLTGTSFG